MAAVVGKVVRKAGWGGAATGAGAAEVVVLGVKQYIDQLKLLGLQKEQLKWLG
jgi:hypothetical protein